MLAGQELKLDIVKSGLSTLRFELLSQCSNRTSRCEYVKPDLTMSGLSSCLGAQTGHDFFRVRFELLSPELEPDIGGVKSGFSPLRRRARAGHKRAAPDLKPDS